MDPRAHTEGANFRPLSRMSKDSPSMWKEGGATTTSHAFADTKRRHSAAAPTRCAASAKTQASKSAQHHCKRPALLTKDNWEPVASTH
ncbi:MAG: hypothetical protein GY772_16035 [bacterium]|nr:hypothetical protein [bacterium]